MHARFFIQPSMAFLLALKDGRRDARENRPAFLVALAQATDKKPLLMEAWKSVSTAFVIAVIIDVIFSFTVLKDFYLIQTLVVAVAFAVLPYLLMRGPVRRIAEWREHRKPS